MSMQTIKAGMVLALDITLALVHAGRGPQKSALARDWLPRCHSTADERLDARRKMDWIFPCESAV